MWIQSLIRWPIKVKWCRNLAMIIPEGNSLLVVEAKSATKEAKEEATQVAERSL